MILSDGSVSNLILAPGPTSRYIWVAAGPHPCPRCAQLDGSIRTIEAWAFSVEPGFHKHCECYLECIEQVDSGIAYTNQFSALCLWNLTEALSFAALKPEPVYYGFNTNQDSENADDIVPILSPTGPPPPMTPPSGTTGPPTTEPWVDPYRFH